MYVTSSQYILCDANLKKKYMQQVKSFKSSVRNMNCLLDYNFSNM